MGFDPSTSNLSQEISGGERIGVVAAVDQSTGSGVGSGSGGEQVHGQSDTSLMHTQSLKRKSEDIADNSVP